MEKKDQSVRSQVAIRCAKAAILLYALANRHSKATINNEDEEKEMLKREIEDLKVEMARERMKTKKINLCSLVEVALQVSVVLFVSSFFLMLAFKPN
ncbi:uncharacterized protein LOC123203766 [Mangifera indica]|uniref:uncharacterized protein LOC123203766 n=1 Tax=Mangifera indica TaxID=29780 RepID=UPI001CFC280F|nr:uncharacterized protein LOC123203766 [Mangifera indica]